MLKVHRYFLRCSQSDIRDDDGTLVNAVVGSGFGFTANQAINSNIAVGSRCPKDNSQVTYYVS
jgi:hypothetical protein